MGNVIGKNSRKDVYERFAQASDLVVREEIREDRVIYMPVYEYNGEAFSEFDYFFLKKISQDTDITVNGLKEYCGRTHGAVSQQLSRYEKAGLIQRKKNEKDGRITNIFLTERGRRVVEEMKKKREAGMYKGIEMLLDCGHTLADINAYCEVSESLVDIRMRNIFWGNTNIKEK